MQFLGSWRILFALDVRRNQGETRHDSPVHNLDIPPPPLPVDNGQVDPLRLSTLDREAPVILLSVHHLATCRCPIRCDKLGSRGAVVVHLPRQQGGRCDALRAVEARGNQSRRDNVVRQDARQKRRRGVSQGPTGCRGVGLKSVIVGHKDGDGGVVFDEIVDESWVLDDELLHRREGRVRCQGCCQIGGGIRRCVAQKGSEADCRRREWSYHVDEVTIKVHGGGHGIGFHPDKNMVVGDQSRLSRRQCQPNGGQRMGDSRYRLVDASVLEFTNGNETPVGRGAGSPPRM